MTTKDAVLTETALLAWFPGPAQLDVEFSQVGHLMVLLNRLFMLNEALQRAIGGLPISAVFCWCTQLTVFDSMCEFLSSQQAQH